MPFAFSLPEIPTLPILGREDKFPVRRIFCVGRNYAEHALEMGGDPNREPPFFFSKPADALVQNGTTIPYPQATKNFHYEMELVIAIGKGGRDIAPTEAPSCIFGYASGLDLTRRDLQKQAKEKGRPWDSAKGFDLSAPCSAITPADRISDLSSSQIWLDVNGERQQHAFVRDMIWNVEEIIVFLSCLFEIKPGDLIYTGTPAGVGPIHPGDSIVGAVKGLEEIHLKIA